MAYLTPFYTIQRTAHVDRPANLHGLSVFFPLALKKKKFEHQASLYETPAYASAHTPYCENVNASCSAKWPLHFRYGVYMQKHAQSFPGIPKLGFAGIYI